MEQNSQTDITKSSFSKLSTDCLLCYLSFLLKSNYWKLLNLQNIYYIIPRAIHCLNFSELYQKFFCKTFQ